jgi:hypothetical protein
VRREEGSGRSLADQPALARSSRGSENGRRPDSSVLRGLRRLSRRLLGRRRFCRRSRRTDSLHLYATVGEQRGQRADCGKYRREYSADNPYCQWEFCNTAITLFDDDSPHVALVDNLFDRFQKLVAARFNRLPESTFFHRFLPARDLMTRTRIYPQLRRLFGPAPAPSFAHVLPPHVLEAPDPLGKAKPVALEGDRSNAAAHELGYVRVASCAVEALEDLLLCCGPAPSRGCL